MIKFYFLLIFLSITTFCFSQNDFSFSIIEVGLLGGSHDKYIFENNKLSVFKNLKKIDTVNLSEGQKIKIDSIFLEMGIENFKDSYERTNETIIIDGVKKSQEIRISDGVQWFFNFKYGGKEKNIFLDNYYIDKLGVFVRYLNSLIKKKSQLITFGNMYLEPDTVIYYFPEFMNENAVLPDTNYWIKDISCYGKGDFVTQIFDLTFQCSCRIALKNSYVASKYWMIYRLKNKNWKKEYYDKSQKVIKVEYLKEIIPRETKNEVINIYEGIKPSVVIHRYYKTEIIEIQE